MKSLRSNLSRLFAAGLVGAVLAAPLSASAAGFSVIGDTFTAPRGGGVLAPPEPEYTRVNSPYELEKTLNKPGFTGRVLIPRDVQWDMTGYGNITLHSGVQLVGERGALASRPLLYTTAPTYYGAEYNFFMIDGNDVQVEGIHFRGPANGIRRETLPFVSGIKIVGGRRIYIFDNEMEEWTKSAVQVELNVPRAEAGLIRVERNYIHNNARDGGGHGVGVSKDAYVTIEGNVFDYNRHAVEAEGYCGGYIARFNYVLQGGYRQDGTVGSYYNQHFDAHGSNGGYGGRAGEFFDISFNTVRGEQDYYLIKTRPALMLRGTPDIGCQFNGNVLVHDDSGEAISFKGVDGDDLIRAGKFSAAGNRYDTDYSTDLATGDFDGDGRTDVFIANGTGWFYSRGGVRQWQFLHASDKRTQELGFADIDNDGITDVLYRDPSGNLGYLRAGIVPLANFTTVPVSIKELRFGDFDGDRKTDIFYTKAGQWWIWYGKTRLWTSAASSSLALSEFLFGEFDAVPGTDVAAVTSGMWACSSGGTGSWTRMNSQLTKSFADAVAADFDGNGRTDIAFNDGRDWRFSADGRSPMALLRDSPTAETVLGFPSLKSWLIGRFDGGTKASVVTFERRLELSSIRPVTGERLVIWRGLGTGSAFSTLSGQNIR